MAARMTAALRAAYVERAAVNPTVPPLDVPWGLGEIAAYLDVAVESVRTYRRRARANREAGTPKPGDLPEPDGWTGRGRGPWWWPATIIRWDAYDRPGQGTGGGRPAHRT
ncbi:hypothetical protein GCM10012275_54660 [Longimycelium tulufanense]|uniref:Uncharacterized protein n=1 Tax=Longimycelium tulufanense TaxID=907463 RepID=A0A8J3CJQ1_9PSEU|nr:hypothetical protein GCM10012275_54660 [Longimycelium tulufanense]